MSWSCSSSFEPVVSLPISLRFCRHGNPTWTINRQDSKCGTQLHHGSGCVLDEDLLARHSSNDNHFDYVYETTQNRIRSR